MEADAEPTAVIREYELLISQLIRENTVLKIALRTARQQLQREAQDA